jgi:hypothetical protein
MSKTTSTNSLLLAMKSKMLFVLPILFTVLVSIICAQFVLIAEPIQGLSFFDKINESFVMVILTITLTSIISLLVFFHIFGKRPFFALKILIAAFILGGVLAILLFGKLLFNLLGIASPIFLAVIAIITYAGAYFAYLTMVDALSDRIKNLLFVICSGALGSFLGILIPAVPVIFISLFLSILDLALIRRKTVEKITGKQLYDKLLTNIAFANSDWGVGIGDLTCYAMVVANVLLNFGIFAGSLSLLLVLTGSFLSFMLTLRMDKLPGLPIPITLGLLPSITFLLIL